MLVWKFNNIKMSIDWNESGHDPDVSAVEVSNSTFHLFVFGFFLI